MFTFLLESLKRCKGNRKIETRASWQMLNQVYGTFSLTWPASMQSYGNKRVQLSQDWLGTPTWPPFHCFGTPGSVSIDNG